MSSWMTFILTMVALGIRRGIVSYLKAFGTVPVASDGINVL